MSARRGRAWMRILSTNRCFRLFFRSPQHRLVRRTNTIVRRIVCHINILLIVYFANLQLFSKRKKELTLKNVFPQGFLDNPSWRLGVTVKKQKGVLWQWHNHSFCLLYIQIIVVTIVGITHKFCPSFGGHALRYRQYSYT